MAIKCSVDVDLRINAICGWASEGAGVATVTIGSRGLTLASNLSDLMRPDVKAAGLHSTGECGFIFPEDELGLVKGNIYTVTVMPISSEAVVVHRLYGDYAALLKVLSEFEVQPRDDVTCLAVPYEHALEQYTDVVMLKYLLIRLRRGKRAKGCRGRFEGVEYPNRDYDFSRFRSIFEGYLSVWLKLLDARYLWSIVDTYADYGFKHERFAALAVSNYMFAERFFQTRKCLFNSERKSDEEIQKRSQGQLPYWGGMLTNKLDADDSMDIFITRNLEILSDVPVVKSIFIELLKRAAKEADSGFGMNLNNSKYFDNGFDVYKEHFFN